MATIDELSVKVSANTASFQAGAEAVESQLDDLSNEAIQTAAAMSILSDRSERAGDNISQVGRQSTTAAVQMGVLQAATSAANTSFLGISATTYAALIPALVALTAALFPVVGALGGFIAVAGAIGGIGLVGIFGAISQQGERLQSMFSVLVESVQDTFAPVFTEAASVLLTLMGSLTRVVNNMDPAQDTIEEFGSLFAELGDIIIDSIPAFVDLAVQLTDDFLPPFVEFAEDVLPDVPGMIRGLVQVFRRMIPRFARAGELLADFVPAFTELGFTVLNVLGPALTTLTEIGIDVIEWFNSLSESVQKAGAALSLIGPFLAVIATTMGGPLLAAGRVLLSSALVPIVSSLSTFASLLAPIVGGLTAIVGVTFNVISAFIPFTGVVSSLIGTLTGLLGSLGGVISTIGTIAALIGTGGILFVAVGAAIGLFVRFEDEIRAVFDRVLPIISGAINDAMNWLQTTGADLAHKAMEKLGSVIRTALLEVKRMIMNPEQSIIINAVKDMANWIMNNGPGLMKKAWDTIVDVTMAAFQGLYDGLIGNSLIPEMIRDIKDAFLGFANWVKTTFADTISNVFGEVAQAIGDAFGTFELNWPDEFQQIIDFFGGNVKQALNFIEGKIDIGGGGGDDSGGGGSSGGGDDDGGGTGGGDDPPPPGIGPPGGGGRGPGAPVDPTGIGGITPANAMATDEQAVADGFDNSQVAREMRDKLDQIDNSVRDDGTVRVREQDVVRGLERMFDRQNGSL